MTPLVLGRTLINTDEVLGTYNGHLMSQSEQLKLQRSTPTKAEGEQRSEGGMICDHADLPLPFDPVDWRNWEEHSKQ